MIRSYELRLKPKAAQRAAMQHILADSAETYNAALQERRDAWKLCQKAVTYYDQQAELTELRQDPQFAAIAVDIQREPLRRVDRAFKAFFRRVKAGQKPGYPRYRSLARYDSFLFGAPKIRERQLKVPNVGWFKFKAHQKLIGTPKTATV